MFTPVKKLKTKEDSRPGRIVLEFIGDDVLEFIGDDGSLRAAASWPSVGSKPIALEQQNSTPQRRRCSD